MPTVSEYLAKHNTSKPKTVAQYLAQSKTNTKQQNIDAVSRALGITTRATTNKPIGRVVPDVADVAIETARRTVPGAKPNVSSKVTKKPVVTTKQIVDQKKQSVMMGQPTFAQQQQEAIRNYAQGPTIDAMESKRQMESVLGFLGQAGQSVGEGLADTFLPEVNVRGNSNPGRAEQFLGSVRDFGRANLRGAGELAVAIPTAPIAIPMSATVHPDGVVGVASDFARDFIQKWSDPVQSAKEGRLAEMVLDLAAGFGALKVGKIATGKYRTGKAIGKIVEGSKPGAEFRETRFLSPDERVPLLQEAVEAAKNGDSQTAINRVVETIDNSQEFDAMPAEAKSKVFETVIRGIEDDLGTLANMEVVKPSAEFPLGLKPKPVQPVVEKPLTPKQEAQKARYEEKMAKQSHIEGERELWSGLGGALGEPSLIPFDVRAIGKGGKLGKRQRGYEIESILNALPGDRDTNLTMINERIARWNKDKQYTSPKGKPRAFGELSDGWITVEEAQALANTASGQLKVGGTRKVAPKAEVVKQPWDLTREEFVNSVVMDTRNGKNAVLLTSKLTGNKLAKWVEFDKSVGHKQAVDIIRKKFVEDAIESGESVRPEVLADYPDLAAKYGKSIESKPAAEPIPVNIDPVETSPAIIKQLNEPVKSVGTDYPPLEPPAVKTAVAPKEPKYAGSINLDRIDTSKQLREAVIKHVTDADGEVSKVRIKRSREEVQKLADEIFVDVDSARKIAEQVKDLDAVGLRIRQLHADALETMGAAQRAYEANPTDVNLLKFKAEQAKYDATMLALQGTSNAAGRFLGMHNIIVKGLANAERGGAAAEMLLPVKKSTRGVSRNSPEYGANNKIFTKVRADAAKARILEKTARLNTGIEPTLLIDAVEYGGFIFESELRGFAEWSVAMKDDVGQWVEPHLDRIWQSIQSETAKRAGRELTPQEEIYNRILKKVGGREDALDVMAKFREIDSGDIVGQAKFLQKMREPTVGDKISAYQVGNLLSSPVGAVKDVFSTNVWDATYQLGIRPMQAAVESVRGRIKGESPRVFMAEVPQALKGQFSSEGISRGWSQFVEILKEGFTEEQALKLDIPMHYEFEGKMGVFNYGPRLRTGLDQFKRQMVIEGEARARATRQGLTEGLKGEELKRRIEDLVPDYRDSAEVRDFSDTIMFTDEITKGSLLQKIYDIREFDAGRGVKPVRLMLPFVKTLYNLMARATELTPYGAVKGLKSEYRGTTTQTRMIAQSVVGTAAMIMIADEALKGNVTTSAPKSKNDRELWYAEGKQPYSMRVGDKWYDYRSWGPWSFVIGGTAGMLESYDKGEKLTPGNVSSVATRFALNAMRTGADMSMMTGLRDFSNALQDPDRYAERWMSNFVGGFVPFSTGVRAVAQGIDPKVRQTEGIAQNIQSGIPFASRSLPTRVNAFGEEVERARSGLNIINPIAGSPVNDDPVIVELRRVGVNPSLAGNKLKVGDEYKKLSPAEQSQYQLMKGQEIHKRLKSLIGSEEYKSLTDEQKQSALRRAMLDAGDTARSAFKTKQGWSKDEQIYE